jgi:hypothetical protein
LILRRRPHLFFRGGKKSGRIFGPFLLFLTAVLTLLKTAARPGYAGPSISLAA